MMAQTLTKERAPKIVWDVRKNIIYIQTIVTSYFVINISFFGLIYF